MRLGSLVRPLCHTFLGDVRCFRSFILFLIQIHIIFILLSSIKHFYKALSLNELYLTHLYGKSLGEMMNELIMPATGGSGL